MQVGNISSIESRHMERHEHTLFDRSNAAHHEPCERSSTDMITQVNMAPASFNNTAGDNPYTCSVSPRYTTFYNTVYYCILNQDKFR